MLCLQLRGSAPHVSRSVLDLGYKTGNHFANAMLGTISAEVHEPRKCLGVSISCETLVFTVAHKMLAASAESSNQSVCTLACQVNHVYT